MLTIDFNICLESGCETFTFTETTGAYSATNLTGWGAPNALTSSITTAVLQVTAPSGAMSTINLLTEGFPSSNPSFSYDFAASVVDTYEDGKWEFLLFYDDGAGNTYMKKYVRLFYCTTKCCVDTMLAALEADDCDCNTKNSAAMTNYLKAIIFLEMLKNAAKCYQVDNFTSIKAILDKLCANSGCQTCK